MHGAERCSRFAQLVRHTPVLTVFLACMPLLAQPLVPSQLVPPTLRALPPVENDTLVLPQRGTAAPAPSVGESLSVRLDGIVVRDDFADMATMRPALPVNSFGDRITISEIYQLAAALERRYATAGYLLVRVVIPPQELADGATLFLRVIDGFIETIDVEGVPAAARHVAASRSAPLIGQRHLTVGMVERQLLLSGDVPGLELSSTLEAGRRDGGSKLVLAGTYRLMTALISVDNRLDEAYGRWQLKFNAAFNGALGLGEQLYLLALAGGADRLLSTVSPLQVIGVGSVVGLGDGAVTLNPEMTWSATRTSAAGGVPASRGTYSRLALRGGLAIQRIRRENLNATLALERVAQRLSAPDFGVDLSSDRYDALRTGLNYGVVLESGATWQAVVTASHGLGGRRAEDAAAGGVPLSRQSAGPDFNKVAISLRSGWVLPGAVQFGLSALGQTSFGRPLLRSEEFALDGEDAVSTVPAGSLGVDSGATIRAELGRELAYGRVRVNPYGLFVAGRGSVFAPTGVEQPTVRVHAFGLGLRSSAGAFGSVESLRFTSEWARTKTNISGRRSAGRWMLGSAMSF